MIVTVVGLAFEARIAARTGMPVLCGNAPTLAAALDRAILKGCSGLISFGVAGGLAPELRPGTCVVASDILCGSARYTTDATWSRTLLETIPGAVHGTIVGVPEAVAHPDAKRSLFQETGAVAVDMESHLVATAAAAHGLPMIAVRAVTDPAERALPLAALSAVRPNGTIDLLALACALMKRPRDIYTLMRTAIDTGAARATLNHGRMCLEQAEHSRSRPSAQPLYGPFGLRPSMGLGELLMAEATSAEIGYTNGLQHQRLVRAARR